jgi:hypothetical protein
VERPAPLQNSQSCPHCGAAVEQPEWSENVGKEVLCIWHCLACGKQFETQSSGVGHELSPAELAERFLPNLVVE